ncbi:MAG: hypothetical protein ACI8SK_000275 [Shewanella sp.]|jgi:hypothetical protein
MARANHTFRVHRNVAKKTISKEGVERYKCFHFMLTIFTFGLWGGVWWWLILKSEGKTVQFFRGFDDAYWSYLIEREQPPAALHKMKIGGDGCKGHFDA